MSKTLSLLEKAKTNKVFRTIAKGKPSKEEVELFIAYFKGDITTKQLAVGLSLKNGTVSYAIASFIRRCYANDMIVFKEVL